MIEKQIPYESYLNGLEASLQLMQKASDKGSFIEFIVLCASIIDAILRMAIMLKTQTNLENSEIMNELLYQGDDDKTISERKIYSRAKELEIIDDNLFNTLNSLYNDRNKVVHRYIISEITTKDIMRIALAYNDIFMNIRMALIKKVEDEQMQKKLGITVPAKDIPVEQRILAKIRQQKGVSRKHFGATLLGLVLFARKWTSDHISDILETPLLRWRTGSYLLVMCALVFLVVFTFLFGRLFQRRISAHKKFFFIEHANMKWKYDLTTNKTDQFAYCPKHQVALQSRNDQLNCVLCAKTYFRILGMADFIKVFNEADSIARAKASGHLKN